VSGSILDIPVRKQVCWEGPYYTRVTFKIVGAEKIGGAGRAGKRGGGVCREGGRGGGWEWFVWMRVWV